MISDTFKWIKHHNINDDTIRHDTTRYDTHQYPTFESYSARVWTWLPIARQSELSLCDGDGDGDGDKRGWNNLVERVTRTIYYYYFRATIMIDWSITITSSKQSIRPSKCYGTLAWAYGCNTCRWYCTSSNRDGSKYFRTCSGISRNKIRGTEVGTITPYIRYNTTVQIARDHFQFFKFDWCFDIN